MAEDRKLIYETKDWTVSHKNGKPTVRTARFLKPCTKDFTKAVCIPNSTPLLAEVFPHDMQKWPSEVLFKGWKQPQKKWKEWVRKSVAKYGPIWKKTGIYDAIMTSLCEVRLNQDLILGLSEFWCPKTNTFVFPWGEATVTLEDVMILGGYPVLGKPVTCPISREQVKIQEEMEKCKAEIARTKVKKAAHSAWLKHFMEAEGDYEHVAFLSLWLSRYVFPSPPGNLIGKHVFPIAVHLSQGTSIALGHAVLVSLYRDLTLLTTEAATSSESAIVVSAPFQLLQLWAFERFPHLGPSKPNTLDRPGQPRACRWDKLNSRASLPIIRSALRLVDNFRWRPYGANLTNWRHRSYYQETANMVLDFYDLDKELGSFHRCLQPFELVGVDCIAQYLPHRVAMQFGFDQDLPTVHLGSNIPSLEHVWLYVPSRSYEPFVSTRYMKWWKDCMHARKDLIKDFNSPEPLSIRFPESKAKRNPSPASPHSPFKTKISGPRPWLSGYSCSSPTTRSELSLVCKPEKSPYFVPERPKNQTFHNNKADDGVAGPENFHYSVAKTASSSVHQYNSSQNVSPSASTYGSTLSTTVGNFKAKVTNPRTPLVRRNRIAPLAGRGASHLANYPNVPAKEVKRKAGSYVDEKYDPLDFVSLSQRIKQMKGGKGGSVNGAAGKKWEKAKTLEIQTDPINVNSYTNTSTSRLQKAGLEGRVQRIEKMLGVKLD